MHKDLIRYVIIIALLSSVASVQADGSHAGSAASTTPTVISKTGNKTKTKPTDIDPRYATPSAVIKTLALAIKAGNARCIRQSIVIQGDAGRAAVAAFARISAASENFSKTALYKLGPPPKGMSAAFVSIDTSMDRLMAQLPKAIITMHQATAMVQFPASSNGRGQTIFVQNIAGIWKIDGSRLLHLNQPGMAAKAVRHRARQLTLMATALNETTSDINIGKVTTWTNLEKDMELHILESEAALDTAGPEQDMPPAATASPPPSAGK